jgi:hypothetical protein
MQNPTQLPFCTYRPTATAAIFCDRPVTSGLDRCAAPDPDPADVRFNK